MNKVNSHCLFDVNFVQDKISFARLFRVKLVLSFAFSLIVFLGLISLLLWGKVYLLEKEVSQLKITETNAEKTLAGMYKNDVVAILGDKQKMELRGFGQILQGLATLHYEQLWLNTLNLKGSPLSVSIYGQALDSSLVQLYYAKLLALPVFSRLDLRIIEINDVKKALSQKEKQTIERQKSQGLPVDNFLINPVTDFTISNLPEKEIKKKRGEGDPDARSRANGF
ncbi:MAG: hypothetical protein K0S08_576 [Gammaproteobacteria bacterium]|jgi:hypothetical protein|nr:hypothetical protein [Gammaproteobacteria bacterium]